MAFEDDDDEKDKLEEAVDSSDPMEEQDSSDDEEGPAPLKEEPKETEEDPEKEIADDEAVEEELATKKSPKQEIKDEADDLLAGLPKEEHAAPMASAPQAAPSKLDDYHKFLNEYKRLQQNRQNSDLVAGLMAAGGQIGQSMAGRISGNFKPNTAGIDMMKQQANRPVTDLEQGQVVQGRAMQLQGQQNSLDPNSSQSKLVRQYLNERMFKENPLPETVSAADAASIMKMIGKPQATHLSQLPMVNQQTGEKTMAVFNPTLGAFTSIDGKPLGTGWVRDYRAQSFTDAGTGEKVGFSGGTGKVTGPLTGPGVSRPGVPENAPPGKPIELTRTMLTAQQQKQLDHTRDKFLGEVKDDRNAINSADRVINVLDKGDELNGDILGELRDQMSRAFGQKGHITDAQMGRILGREDWKSKFQNAVSVATTGKLDDENRQFLRQVMQAIRDQNQMFVTNKSKVYSQNLASDFGSAPNLAKAHVSPDSINKLINVQAAAASSAEKVVTAKGYNKKTNKTQFIYSDGSKETVDGER